MIEEDLVNCLMHVLPDVFPLYAPKDQDGPFITYRRIGTSRAHDLTAPTGLAKPLFYVDIYADTFIQARQLAELARGVLNCPDIAGGGNGVAYGSILHVHLENEIDNSELEPTLYRITQEYRVTHLEP